MRHRRLTVRTALFAAAAVLFAAAPARADLLIAIDKTTQTMTVSLDGEPIYRWPVSTGKKGYNTPAGAFTPFRREREHYSREWDNAPMPYSIFFTRKGHAIHGSSHRNIGRPASHGCVRLSVRNAAKLWRLVRRAKMAKTTVVLTGHIPPPRSEAVARAEPEKPMGDLREQRDAREADQADRPDDADFTAALPPPPRESRQVWREYRRGSRYYYYRIRPYVRSYYYRRGGVRFYFRW
jgi:L,D-transpeptidase catalytic domain